MRGVGVEKSGRIICRAYRDSIDGIRREWLFYPAFGLNMIIIPPHDACGGIDLFAKAFVF